MLFPTLFSRAGLNCHGTFAATTPEREDDRVTDGAAPSRCEDISFWCCHRFRRTRPAPSYTWVVNYRPNEGMPYNIGATSRCIGQKQTAKNGCPCLRIVGRGSQRTAFPTFYGAYLTSWLDAAEYDQTTSHVCQTQVQGGQPNSQLSTHPPAAGRGGRCLKVTRYVDLMSTATERLHRR